MSVVSEMLTAYPKDLGDVDTAAFVVSPVVGVNRHALTCCHLWADSTRMTTPSSAASSVEA